MTIRFIVMFIEICNYKNYKSSIANIWTDTNNRTGIRCRSGSHPFNPDINPWGNIYPRYDVNENGVVDIGDLTIIGQHFNEIVSAPYPRYDVNSDGVGIAGVQIDVFFDGNTLEPLAVKEGNLLDQNGAILENSSVIDPDVFTTITFKAKNAGASFIELKNVKISKPSGDLLKVNVSNRTSLNIISNTNNDGNSGSSGVSSAGGGGGGGGAGGTSGENYSNIEIKEKYDRFINKDLSTSYVFKNTDPIISVNITGNINAGEINTAVEVLRNTSSNKKDK